MQQVAGERPRVQCAARGGGPDFRKVIQAPAQLARAVMRRERQAGEVVDFGGPARQPLEPGGIAPVLPGDHRGERPAVRGVPAGQARALHGESGRGPARDRHELGELRERGRHAARRFHPHRARRGRARFPGRDSDQRGARELAVGAIGRRARRMAALVDRDVDGIRQASASRRLSGAIDSTIATPRACRPSACAASRTS